MLKSHISRIAPFAGLVNGDQPVTIAVLGLSAYRFEFERFIHFWPVYDVFFSRHV